VVAPSPIPFQEGDPLPIALDEPGIDGIVDPRSPTSAPAATAEAS
jgi:hypothetical protein